MTSYFWVQVIVPWRNSQFICSEAERSHDIRQSKLEAIHIRLIDYLTPLFQIYCLHGVEKSRNRQYVTGPLGLVLDKGRHSSFRHYTQTRPEAHFDSS
jgi:hypothetical protein